MFECVTTIQFRLGKIEDALRIYRGLVAPIIKQQPGLKNLCLLSDRKTASIHVITLWETEADAHSLETNALYQKAIAKLRASFACEPTQQMQPVRTNDKRASTRILMRKFGFSHN